MKPIDPGSPADATLRGQEDVSLTNCDREPIHIPGSIQPHGVLLVCSQPEWSIIHASTNADLVLGQPAEALIGRPILEFVPSEVLHKLRNLLQQANLSASPERLFGLPLVADRRPVDIAIHGAGDKVIVELEPVSESRVEGDDPLTMVKSLVGRLRQPGTVADLCERAVRQVRALTGFDRVMVYRFAHDGSGQVVAEVKRSDLEPFLDLHYPATDIPRQARELYRHNWTRLIADVDYQPVALTPQFDVKGHAIDLSHAGLRSVSPIHVQYLKNMGVGASMSISILSGDELWGLIACHHYSPRLIAPALRSVVELYGHMFSMQVESRERDESVDYERRARVLHDRLIRSIAPEASLWDNLERYRNLLRELIPNDGIGVWIDGQFAHDGQTPGEETINALVDLLGPASEVCALDNLPSHVPEVQHDGSDVAGVLAIPISRSPRDYIMFFRREVVRTVTWAGQPDKQVTVADDVNQLSPRRSFAAWSETVRGKSSPWLPGERRAAEALRISLLEVILRRVDLAERERRTAQQRQEILIAELNHRVKNVLALMRAMVSRSESEAQDAKGLSERLDGRIRAFAVAHDQLVQSRHRAAALRHLVESELAPYRDDNPAVEAVSIGGADVLLEADAYTSLALVLHELTTNAVKYGALSTPSGSLSVTWEVTSSGDLSLSWSESGGPPAKPPQRKGFGSTLIERSVPYELGGEAEVNYTPSGLQARFLIPALYVSLREPTPARRSAKQRSHPAAGLEGLRILLVEDNLVITLDAEDALRKAGAAEVRTASTVADAVAIVEKGSLDAAIVDIHLGRETAAKIAEALKQSGIPFALATGYGAGPSLPPGLSGYPLVSKPYTGSTLRDAIRALIPPPQPSN